MRTQSALLLFGVLVTSTILACGPTGFSNRGPTAEDPATGADGAPGADGASGTPGSPASDNDAPGPSSGPSPQNPGPRNGPVDSPFRGAGPFEPQLGPSARTGPHPNGPSGLTCVRSDCHGGASEAPRFLFGGTLYGATGADKAAEIRVVDARARVYTAYADEDGNFFALADAPATADPEAEVEPAPAPTPGAGEIVPPVRIGIRNAAVTRVMTTAGGADFGSCNACHQPNNATGGIRL